MVLFFSVRGKGISEINYKKKKNYFLFSGAFFNINGRSFAGKDD